MNKVRIREQIRKIKWATEQQLGRKLGKKGLLEVRDIVMQMQPTNEPKTEPNWKEAPKPNLTKLSVDLNNLIGK